MTPENGLPSPNQVLVADIAAPQEVIQQQVVSQDYLVLRVAVYGLIIAVVMSLVGVITLAYLNKDLPEGVLAMGSAAVGALSTMLVSPGRRS